MKSKILFLIFLTFSIVGRSQDTVKLYLDENYAQTEKANATFIREAVITNNKYFVTDKNRNGQILNYGEYKSINPWIEEGTARHYSGPDSLYATGKYVDGIMVGQWIYYGHNSVDTVNYQPLKTYFLDRKCPKSQFFNEKSNTKELGNQILDSLQNFVAANFHLPGHLLSTKEFVQIINFTFDVDGLIKCPEMAIFIHTDLNSEFFRILQMFHYQASIKKPLGFTLEFPFNKTGDVQNNVYLVCEEDPKCNYALCSESGLHCFRQYINDSLRISSAGCDRTVIVRFVVERNGTIGEISEIKGFENCEGYKEEIERLFESSPPWTPGKMRGVPVKVQYIVPIVIKSSK